MSSESEPATTPARALELPAPIGEPRADALRRLIAIVDRLRDPDGCPWDNAQTLRTVAPHLVEEAHELLEAVETGADREMVEEAGDLLMGIALLARIAEQGGRFDLAQVALAVSDKLVRRHPHVFGETRANSADAALASWEAIKQQERAAKQSDASAIAGVPVALPALQRAQRLGNKAMSAGFRWSDARGALAKLREEVAELEHAFEEAESQPNDAGARGRLEHELGDVLASAAFLGNYVRLDPEAATRAALRRFEARFRWMERSLRRPLNECSLEEMMRAWQEAKLAAGAGKPGDP